MQWLYSITHWIESSQWIPVTVHYFSRPSVWLQLSAATTSPIRIEQTSAASKGNDMACGVITYKILQLILEIWDYASVDDKLTNFVQIEFEWTSQKLNRKHGHVWRIIWHVKATRDLITSIQMHCNFIQFTTEWHMFLCRGSWAWGSEKGRSGPLNCVCMINGMFHMSYDRQYSNDDNVIMRERILPIIVFILFPVINQILVKC